MSNFLLALFGGAFVFGNLVRLLNPPLPLRKDPSDRWDWLWAIFYWPIYFGSIFPSLSSCLLFIMTGQPLESIRSGYRMLTDVFVWDSVRLTKQGLTLVCWLCWGFWIESRLQIDLMLFWTIFTISPILWLCAGSGMLLLLLKLIFEILPSRRLKHA